MSQPKENNNFVSISEDFKEPTDLPSDPPEGFRNLQQPVQISTSVPASSEPMLPVAVKSRLDQFVKCFVTQLETKLAAYRLILQGEATKSGKFAEVTSEVISGALGHLSGLLGTAARKVVEKIGSECHLKKAAKRKGLVEIFRADEAEFRRSLVEAGVDVFQSFEMQFMRVTTEQGVDNALLLLARDAATRVINNWREENELSIAERVICGKSKRQKIYNVNPGFAVMYEYQSSEMKWITTNLYEKVGVVLQPENTLKYYKRKDGESDTGGYGYRRLLVGEKLSESYDGDDIAASGSGTFTDYQYTIDTKDLDKLVSNILQIMNNEDASLTEDRIKEVLVEVKTEILDEIGNVKFKMNEMGNENREQLKEYILNLNIEEYQFKQYFTKYANQSQESMNELKTQNSSLQASIDAHRDEHRENFYQLTQKISEINQAPRNEQKTRSIWYNVKEPTLHFTGRKRELDDLHSKIHNEVRVTVISQVTSISGLGGIGKTELARQYVQKKSEDFDNNVVWINAQSEATLTASFRKLACDELGWTERKEEDTEKVVKDIYRFFAHSKCLFIFDNAENIGTIRAFLPVSLPPDSNKPYVLVTSRNQKWELGIRMVNLTELELTEAVELVKTGLSVTDSCQDEQITRLAKVMQCFPLALQQAVAYIREEQQKAKRRGSREYKLADYLKQYEQKKKELLDSNVFRGLDNDYAKTTFTTWNITIDKIKEVQGKGTLALKIFELIAYMDPNNIPVEKFFSSLVQNTEELWQSVELLEQYSMIRLSQGSLDVHRLVQQVTRIKLEEQGKKLQVIEEALETLDLSLPLGIDKKDLPKARQLFPHLFTLGEAYSDFGKDKITTLLDRALQNVEKYNGKGSTEVATALSIFANACDDFGEPQEVIRLLEKALKIDIEQYGEDHLKVGITLFNLANAYNDLNDFSTMKELLEKALIIEEKHYKEDCVEMHTTISNLANACERLGEEEQAKVLRERALKIEAKHGIPKHSKCFELLQRRGIHTRDRYKEYCGPVHLEIAKLLIKLGDVRRRSGNLTEQTELLELALDIHEKHYGREHIQLVAILKNLGDAYGSLGDSESATRLSKRALDIQNAHDLEQPSGSHRANVVGQVNPLLPIVAQAIHNLFDLLMSVE